LTHLEPFLYCTNKHNGDDASKEENQLSTKNMENRVQTIAGHSHYDVEGRTKIDNSYHMYRTDVIASC